MSADAPAKKELRGNQANIMIIIIRMTVLILVAFGLTAFLLNRCILFEVEGGSGEHSVLARSWFGAVPISSTPHGFSSLMNEIYPGCILENEKSIDWYDGVTGNEMKSSQLTVLGFRCAATLDKLQEWYQKRLGSAFLKSTLEALKPDGTLEDWTPIIEGELGRQAFLLRQELSSHRLRFVAVEQRGVEREAWVVLGDYMRGPG